MKKKQKLEDLNVLNDFMLSAIANDPDVAEPFFRDVLSVLLEREIGEVTVRAQMVIPGDNLRLRGIRMDVEILEEDNSPAKCRIYNLESQMYEEANLQKRNRFYQAKKDSKGLKRGEKNWNKLPDLYMIMIMDYDFFGKDNMMYVFENVCREFPDIEYNDGLKFIYFNVNGKNGGTKTIKQLLSYLNNSKIESVTNETIGRIHNYVSSVKESAEVREHYMTWDEWVEREIQARLDEAVKEALEEAVKEAVDEAVKDTQKETTITATKSLLLDILTDKGEVPTELQKCIDEADLVSLKQWTRMAAKVDSIQAFVDEIQKESLLGR